MRKRQIDDKKLDEMLENMYGSKVNDNFHFNSEMAEKNSSEFYETVSGSVTVKRRFPYARVCTAAAALVITFGAVLYNIPQDNFTPMAQGDGQAVSYTEEKSLFNQYLEEFEYEINNFDYECIKVTPESMFPDNEEERIRLDEQNNLYTYLTCQTHFIPCYEGFKSEEQNDVNTEDVYNYNSEKCYYSQFLSPDSEFYCYVKKIDGEVVQGEGEEYIPPYYVQSDENEQYIPVYYTQQVYLVWKDENGNITKIKPSVEKITDEDISSIVSFNSKSCKQVEENIKNIQDNFVNEDSEVYINDILVRPSISEDNQKSESVHAGSLFNGFVYIRNNGVLTPVNIGVVQYDTQSMADYGDEYKEIDNIPFIDACIDNGTIHYKKTFFYDCSQEEPIDISENLINMENFWRETAIYSESDVQESINESLTIEDLVTDIQIEKVIIDNTEISEEFSETQSIEETVSDEAEQIDDFKIENFCFTDLANMSNEERNAVASYFGDTIQICEKGATLCTYCMEQNGIDFSEIQVYPDLYVYWSENLDARTLYNSIDNPNKKLLGINYDENGEKMTPEQIFEDNNNDYSAYEILVCEEEYALNIYIPCHLVNLSDKEKAVFEEFHNRPYAVLSWNIELD